VNLNTSNDCTTPREHVYTHKTSKSEAINRIAISQREIFENQIPKSTVIRWPQ